MRREYPNGFLHGLRYAAKHSDDSYELLDAIDEIERLREALAEALRLLRVNDENSDEIIAVLKAALAATEKPDV